MYGSAQIGYQRTAKRGHDLPRLRHDLALCALLVTGLVSGCSTSNGGLQQLASTVSVIEPGDPALPERVGVLPSASGVDPQVVEVTEEDAPAQVAAADSPADAAAEDALAADADADPVVASISPQAGTQKQEAISPQDKALAAGMTPTAFAAPTRDTGAMAAVFTPGGKVAARSPELDALIEKYASHHAIPVSLLRRVVNRESTFNPEARNGPYWGLMQILPATARTMGYKGEPHGLLDAETNLMYAGRYLRGAYLVAGGDHDLAVRYYSRGYYYDAKRRGMLQETGLGQDRRRMNRGS